MTTQIPMAPSQFYAMRFAIYSTLGVPGIKLETWRLSVTGLVENELGLSFEAPTSAASGADERLSLRNSMVDKGRCLGGRTFSGAHKTCQG